MDSWIILFLNYVGIYLLELYEMSVFEKTI